MEAYRAWANFYHAEPSEELMQFIQDSEHRQPHVLNLSVCPGIEAGTNVTFDLQPVFAALRHNSYYLSVELCDSVQQGVVMQHLADFLKYNRYVTRLVLRNLTSRRLLRPCCAVTFAADVASLLHVLHWQRPRREQRERHPGARFLGNAAE